ncbi:MscL family protein [Mycoplasma sp. ES3157-GEN-MYC]|uniref:MscL family protein n=1 Tax=Mycoplasma miroungigenitalium TaxID=754515 RepID=A0A6M4JFA7_9MOLU|nr:MscL family protein [Mycoplasma miroungigenitalium]MBU4690282.1 MscL family protein [Mycoplasma miroungigenitalium]MBU4691549.1 MscL family protein [Mycoplasma miroungigenitalium]QJR43381.1 MscL family protein [Mycoplasma miroungigenitalium]
MFKKASKDAWAVVKKSNMFMLAIGLLIGASFNEVVKSLANDVILPPIAKLTGAETLEKWKVGDVLIGKFLAALFAFIIVTLVIYLLLMIVFLIKAAVDFKKILKIKEQPQPIPEPTTEQLILAELKKLNENLDQAKTKKEDKK